MSDMSESQESNFDITTLSLIRVNEICKAIDRLTILNAKKNTESITTYYGLLKSFYNNLQVMLSDKEKEKWDKVFVELERRAFAAPDRIDVKTFEYLDKTEMELRRLQKRVGFSIMSRYKVDMKKKLRQKLTGG